MTQATQNTGAGPKTQKAFPDPEIPEGIDNGEENGEDTPKRPLSPREEALARMEASFEEHRQHEMEDELGEEGSAEEAHQQEGAAPAHGQEHPGEDTAKAGVTEDPLANYIVMENGNPMLLMKVDGQVTKVPLETARAQLQKGIAGDSRLQEAAARNKILDEREARIREQEAALVAQLQQKNSPPPVNTDVSDQDLRDEVQQVVNGLFTGTEDEAVDRLTKLIGKNRQATAPVDTSQIVKQATEAARAQLASERAEEEARRQQQAVVDAFKDFKRDFADVAEDDNLFRYADGLSDRIASEHPEWTPSQVMSEAGKRTREWVSSLKGEAPPSVEEIPGDRRDRKRNLTPMPRPSSARVPANEVADSPETPQSIVEQMRAARGQG